VFCGTKPAELEMRSCATNSLVLQHYRYWVLWRCPCVRFLDFQKVKDAERKKAVELFGTTLEPSALASKVRRGTCKSNLD
jgi:Leucine-rich repeat